MGDDSFRIETLKMCIEYLHKSEKSFIRYSVIAIVSLFIMSIAKNKSIIKIPFIGELESKFILENAIYIEALCVLVLLYAFCDWILAIIYLCRHPNYGDLLRKKSFVVVLADWWDKKVNREFLNTSVLLDLTQSLLFLVIFITIFLFFLKVSEWPNPNNASTQLGPSYYFVYLKNIPHFA